MAGTKSMCDACQKRDCFVCKQPPKIIATLHHDDEEGDTIQDLTVINQRSICLSCYGKEIKMMEELLQAEGDTKHMEYDSNGYNVFWDEHEEFMRSKGIVCENGKFKCVPPNVYWTDILMNFPEPDFKRRKKDGARDCKDKKSNCEFRSEVSSASEEENNDEDPSPSRYVTKRRKNKKHIRAPRFSDIDVLSDGVDEDTNNKPNDGASSVIEISSESESDKENNEKKEEMLPFAVKESELQEFYSNKEGSFKKKAKIRRVRRPRWSYQEVNHMLSYVDDSKIDSVRSMQKILFDKPKFINHMKKNKFEPRQSTAYYDAYQKIKNGTHSLVNQKEIGLIIDAAGNKKEAEVPTRAALRLQKRVNKTAKMIDDRRITKFNLATSGAAISVKNKGQGTNNGTMDGIMAGAMQKHSKYVEDRYKGKDKYFNIRVDELAFKKNKEQVRFKQHEKLTNVLDRMNCDFNAVSEIGAFILKSNHFGNKMDIIRKVRANATTFSLVWKMAKQAGMKNEEIEAMIDAELQGLPE
eukprot:911852_1